MCRNIKTLFNLEAPVTEEEDSRRTPPIREKLSSFHNRSKVNEAAFLASIDEIAAVSRNLLNSLETKAPPRDRTEEAARQKHTQCERLST